MKLLATGLLISLLGNSPSPCNCRCVAPAPRETTYQGGNEIVTFRESRIYRSIHGVVRDVNGEPVAGVLVEVFNHPEWILLGYSFSQVEQRRIAVCKTREDGTFCFENIPAGEYELRGSKGTAWNPSHVYIRVNPRSRRSTRTGIELRLTVGT